jgi:hypothetical protein
MPKRVLELRKENPRYTNVPSVHLKGCVDASDPRVPKMSQIEERKQIMEMMLSTKCPK